MVRLVEGGVVLNDLISRADAIEAIRSMTITIGGNNVFPDNVKSSVLDALEFAPSIEAEPVRHGRWLEIGSYDEDGYYDIDYKCSECGRFETLKQPYCHCGAKMDAKEDV